MNTIFTTEIPLIDTYDAIVCGGGPAGVTAAAAIAREGKKTLLIEATGALGGMGTMGLIPAWCPFSDLEKIIYKGLGQRIFETLKKQMPHVPEEKTDWVPIEPEKLKVIYDDILEEHAADVLFHTFISHVCMKDARNIDYIVVTNKSGMTAYRVNIYIDCTGDADVCAWAGAEIKKGDGGQVQPSTMCFVLGNVDEYAFTHPPMSQPELAARMMYDEEFPDIVDMNVNIGFIAPRTVGNNCGHIFDLDGTDPVQLSKAMKKGRKMAFMFRDALAKHFPQAFAGSYVAETPALMGIRESRRIVGDYCLSVQDYIERKSFPDEIARNCYYIDVHNSKEEIEEVQGGNHDITERVKRYGPGESHGIPYGCLVPRDLDNVLVAGRTISTDHMVNASVRVMPVCLATGEAAGVAASIALDMKDADSSGVNTHTVDTALLRSKLIGYGQYLPE